MFARELFALGGWKVVPKATKCELWCKVFKRKGLSEKALDKSVERMSQNVDFVEETARLEAEAEERRNEEAREEAIWTQEVWLRKLQDIVMTPVGEVSADSWMVQEIGKGRIRMTDKMKALDMIGKAKGFYAPQEVMVNGLSEIAQVLASMPVAPLVGSS